MALFWLTSLELTLGWFITFPKNNTFVIWSWWMVFYYPPERSEGGYTVRDFRNLCHMVGFPICVRDLPENEAKVPNFEENFDHQYLWLEMSF